MTTYAIRSTWRSEFGPWKSPMPVDPAPQSVDWNALYAGGIAHAHEDSMDRLNANRTWGTDNPAEPGGYGIVPGYSCDDFGAVFVAEKAQRASLFQPDLEHSIRRTRWPMTAWELTHDTFFARRIHSLDEEIVAGAFSISGPVHTNDPGWTPQNLNSLHAQAMEHPNLGLSWNCRAYGEAAILRAMRQKCDRSLPTSPSAAWGFACLETSQMCAVPGTGQQGNWQAETGLPYNFNEIGQTYTFHEGLKILGTLALCKMTNAPVPIWVRRLMDALESMPAMDYYGVRSIPSYWRTVNGVAVPENRVDQHGDPAFGWWSTNCTILAQLLPGERNYWLDRALRYGPTVATDQQSRVFTMFWRGATGS